MIEYTNVVGAFVWAFRAWREYVVDQPTFNVLVQAGVLGFLFFLFGGAFVLFKLWITQYWQSKKTSPTNGYGEFSYNHQMAATIHDVNKTLSEVAVSNRQIVQMVDRQTETQEKQTIILDRLVRLLDNGKYHLETSGD